MSKTNAIKTLANRGVKLAMQLLLLSPGAPPRQGPAGARRGPRARQAAGEGQL